MFSLLPLQQPDRVDKRWQLGSRHRISGRQKNWLNKNKKKWEKIKTKSRKYVLNQSISGAPSSFIMTGKRKKRGREWEELEAPRQVDIYLIFFYGFIFHFSRSNEFQLSHCFNISFLLLMNIFLDRILIKLDFFIFLLKQKLQICIFRLIFDGKRNYTREGLGAIRTAFYVIK